MSGARGGREGGLTGGASTAIVALALLIASPSPASAQPSPAGSRIVVVTDDRGTPEAARLIAELEALGFEVRVVAPDGDVEGDIPSRLAQTTRREDALAAIRMIQKQPGGIEVWLADRATNKTVLREVLTAKTPPGEGATADEGARAREEIAVRAVELLRASLLETESPGAAKGEVLPGAAAKELARSGLPAPPPASTLPASPPDRRAPLVFVPPQGTLPPLPLGHAFRDFGIHAGVGALFALTDSIPPAFALDIDLHYMPSKRFGVALGGIIPLYQSSYAVFDGTVDTSFGWLGPAARFEVGPENGPFGAAIEPGAGLGWFRVQGQPFEPTLSASDSLTYFAAIHSRGAFSVELTPHFALRADTLIGLALPGKIVSYPTESGTTFAAYLVASGGVESTF